MTIAAKVAGKHTPAYAHTGPHKREARVGDVIGARDGLDFHRYQTVAGEGLVELERTRVQRTNHNCWVEHTLEK